MYVTEIMRWPVSFSSSFLPTPLTFPLLPTHTVADVSNTVYWRTPFSPLCDYKQLHEFYVLHIEPLESKTGGASRSDKVGISCLLVQT